MRASSTARAHASSKSKRPPHNFRLILDTAPDAMLVVDPEGKIALVNSQTEKLFGYTRKELLGEPIERLLPRRSRGRHKGFCAGYFLSPRARPMGAAQKLWAQRKDGTEFPVEINLSSVQTGGRTIVSASVRDLSGRRQMENDLRRSEERFRIALAHSPIVVFHQDRELRYSWIQADDLNGESWPRRNYIGCTDAETIGGEEGAHLMAIKRDVLQRGQGTRTEVAIPLSDGVHYFDLTIEPTRHRQEALAGIMGASFDNTSLRRATIEKEGLIAKLQEALNEVKLLSGLLSICASCKRICDKRGAWHELEAYIQSHSEAKFTHGLCPVCLKKLYPEQYSG